MHIFAGGLGDDISLAELLLESESMRMLTDIFTIFRPLLKLFNFFIFNMLGYGYKSLKIMIFLYISIKSLEVHPDFPLK